ncbi:outer membrane protein assembly factor BamE [Amantichitinum ursilacus]|uniref:Outer membrane protein assembly factor BamE n=1 Tax=Amantichitinum ursilacus TaxID=857265 RepID=A0A0N1JSS1_9NEIS|nr:outer membrane protein assembly factor BamE [Amantichitinum ursilacus]KPC53495.1 Outer membrane protein assembly factor BamE precursor [Amantichitinum ursilacus]
MQIKHSFIAICAAALLAGCSVGNVLAPYKLQIPQGNEITADQVAQLKQGMTRQQVRYVLGTPLLTDAFHGNRWDYVYSEAKGGTMHLERKFTLEFEGDKLKSWQGDTLPASRLIKLGDMASAPVALDDPAAANVATSSTPIAQVASDSAAAKK